MPKPKIEIFISHVAVEAELARMLKKQIESAFRGKCHAFVSSSPDDIKPSDNWFDRLNQSLNKARALLIICSRTSLKSPWLFFEAGFAISKKLKIFPICHGGQDTDSLTIPLSLFNALQLSDSEFSRELISALSEIFHLRPAPQPGYEKMIRDLEQCADSVSFKLKVLRTMEGRFYMLCTVGKLALTLRTNKAVMKRHLSFLKSKGYLKSGKLSSTKEIYYALTSKGRRLLQVGLHHQP
jgi:DNA-binding MarR family transcriptional regulator